MEGRLLELTKSELLSDFITACLQDYESTKTKATYVSMRYSLTAFFDFNGDKELSKLNKRDLSEFVNYRIKAGYAKTSVNIDIRNLKAALSKALEWELIHNNPFYGFKQLKTDRQAPKFLSLEDIHKVSTAIDDPIIKRAFFFYILTGCRREEILSLTWQDLDIERRVIHIKKSKTHLDRWIPINDSLMEIIDTIPHKIGFLFQGKKKGTHLHKDTMTHKIKQYLKKAGFAEMRLHDLRHTFASQLALSGESLQTIRDLLGHTDIRTTEIYAHLTNDHLKAAVNKLKIDIGKE
ncbi:MAG: tyrosine-type recombinase/integrase [Deferribacterales bacterium]